MFEHFLYLILPIFVGQTPKYSVVCFETDCAYHYREDVPPGPHAVGGVGACAGGVGHSLHCHLR